MTNLTEKAQAALTQYAANPLDINAGWNVLRYADKGLYVIGNYDAALNGRKFVNSGYMFLALANAGELTVRENV